MKKIKRVPKTDPVYAYTVDITNVTDINDMLVEFGLAKHNAHQPMTDDELFAIIRYAIEEIPCVTVYNVKCECDCKKKLPWYKRFWRWLTGKKN